MPIPTNDAVLLLTTGAVYSVVGRQLIVRGWRLLTKPEAGSPAQHRCAGCEELRGDLNRESGARHALAKEFHDYRERNAYAIGRLEALERQPSASHISGEQVPVSEGNMRVPDPSKRRSKPG